MCKLHFSEQGVDTTYSNPIVVELRLMIPLERRYMRHIGSYKKKTRGAFSLSLSHDAIACCKFW